MSYDLFANLAVTAIWTTVILMGIYQWKRYWRVQYSFQYTPTVIHMFWREGWRYGSVNVIFSVDCFEPKLTRGFRDWHFVVPLSISQEAMFAAIEKLEPASYYSQADVDKIDMFRELMLENPAEHPVVEVEETQKVRESYYAQPAHI